jgi:hypothetical protein
VLSWRDAHFNVTGCETDSHDDSSRHRGGCARAAAQPENERAVVLEKAPIFVRPDNARTPLRVAAQGTNLEAIAIEGPWINVRFQDPEWGSRVGYIEAKFV